MHETLKFLACSGLYKMFSPELQAYKILYFEISPGAQRVLCALRGPRGLTTVLGHLKGVEKVVLGAVIFNSSDNSEIAI